MDKIVSCARCKKAIVQKEGMVDNALGIRLEGGYGWFIDPYETNCEIMLYLCHECAHAFCAENGWLNEIIEPHNSHSHTYAYVDEHPEHWGWDYDYREAKGR